MTTDPAKLPSLSELEYLLEQARSCLTCGRVHEWTSYGHLQGGTWGTPECPTYRPTSRDAADWLQSLLTLKEGAT